MATSLRAMIPAFLLGLPFSLFAISAASAAPNSGSGGTATPNFICNAELGLCECEGDRSSVDCKAMRRNCKDVDDLFSTESPHDKGKLFCKMAKQGGSGTRAGGGRFRREAQPQGRAAATAAEPVALPAARRSLAVPARAASKQRQP